MSDQAQGLRNLADQMRGEHWDPDYRPDDGSPLLRTEPSTLPVSAGSAAIDARLHRPRIRSIPRRPRARVIAVTSGKGGVGKSNVSTNLSITLGQRGQRVILLDADMGLANAHILFGVSPPYSLQHVMHGTKKLPEVLYRAAENVRLIPGGSGIAELANIAEPMRISFLTGLRELDTECDLIVIDTGAGVASNVLAFLCAVNEVIVVTTPEPTAIANAYATIKAVSRENQGARLMLVVNMVHSSGEGAAVATRLAAITRQFLDLEVEYIGCIPTDPAVPKAVRLRTPFVSGNPGCAAATGINQIIRKLGYGQKPSSPHIGMDGFVNRMQRFFGFHAAT